MQLRLLFCVLLSSFFSIPHARTYAGGHAIGGGSLGKGYFLAADGADCSYAQGYLSGTVDFDPGFGVPKLSSVGKHLGYPTPYAPFIPPTIDSLTISQTEICEGDTIQLTVSGSLGDATTWELYEGSCGGTLLDSNATGSFAISPTTSNVYYVSGAGGGTSNQPCDSISVNVNPSYAYTTVVDFFCSGGNYTFPDGTVMTNITSSVTHVSHLQTTAGCDSTITTNIGVINFFTTVFQNGGTLTSSDPVASYQWVDCANGFASIAGATNQSFTPTQSGQYAVVLSLLGCTDTSSCVQVTVTGREIPAPMGIVSYPNPSTGVFYVTDLPSGPEAIEVVDLQGRGVAFDAVVLGPGKLKVDLGQVAAGMYFVRIRTTETWTVSRVWIARE